MVQVFDCTWTVDLPFELPNHCDKCSQMWNIFCLFHTFKKTQAVFFYHLDSVLKTNLFSNVSYHHKQWPDGIFSASPQDILSVLFSHLFFISFIHTHTDTLRRRTDTWRETLIEQLLISSCHTLVASPCCYLSCSILLLLHSLSISSSLRHCFADVSICPCVSLCLWDVVKSWPDYNVMCCIFLKPV